MRLNLKDRMFIPICILLFAIHIYILLQLIFFLYPELLVYSFLTDKGLLPYKEIIDQHFPGLMFLPVNLKTLGIDTVKEMRLLHLGLTVFSDILFVKLSGKLLKRKILVIISLIFYIFWQIYLEGHVLWIESFVTPLILMAFIYLYKFMRRRNASDIYMSALIFGIAFVFKQTLAPLIFLVFLYLLIDRTGIKKILISLSLVLVPIFLVFVHFWRLGVINDFIYWTAIFNLTVFSQMGKTQPTLTGIFKLSPVFGLTLISIIILIKKHDTKRLLLPGIFFTGTLFFAYARFDFIHLQPALPYAVMICFLSLKYLRKYILIPCLLLYSLVSLYIFIPNFRFFNKPGVSPMLNDPETVTLVNTINRYRKNGEKIFAFGTYLHIYYLTDTLPPGNIFSFQFPWFMKIAQLKVLQGIIEDPPAIIIRDRKSYVDGYALIDYMPDIENYVEYHYRTIDSVNNTEILVKI